MRLLSLKALLPVVAFTVACHEKMMMPLVQRSFVLESVDTQPVPAVINASGGDTTTLFSAVLTMFDDGTAIIAARTRQVHPALPPREATDISHYSYRIIGDSLALDSICLDTAMCVGLPFGKFTSGTTLTLFYGDIGRRAAHNYRGSYALD
jgi:hypothetical protein